eukprot:gb/GECG01010698.1/.p1 GENE.gb/GECG01010698.1/~~gb/GECG01010698.1/.p1  ORF type:complete len:501 (+),score=47.17 gb/GECG01010698.1/:1-1503(+)
MEQDGILTINTMNAKDEDEQLISGRSVSSSDSRPHGGTSDGLRYVTLTVCAIAQLVFGSLYAFSSLADGFEHPSIGIGKTIPVSIIGVAGNTGTFVLGAIPGALVDRYGSSKTMLYGTVVVAIGWMSLWGVVELAEANQQGQVSASSGLIDSLAVVALLIIGQGSVGGFLSAWIAMGSLFSKERRGVVAGTLLAGYSLSAAVCAVLYQSILNANVGAYCIVLAAFGAGLGAASTGLLRMSMRRYHLIDNTTTSPKANISESANEGNNATPEGEEKKYWFLKEWKFWMLYTVVFMNLGAALMYVNSASQMSETLTRDSSSNSGVATERLVLTFALMNGFSRIVAGYTSDSMISRGYSRLLMFVISLSFLTLGAIFALFAKASTLIVVSVLVGIAEGSCFATWPVATRKWFGDGESVRSSGLSFAIMNTSIGFGSLAFNGIFALDYRIAEDHTGSSECGGAHCYRAAFIVAAVVNGASLGLVYWLIRIEKGEKGYTSIGEND